MKAAVVVNEQELAPKGVLMPAAAVIAVAPAANEEQRCSCSTCVCWCSSSGRCDELQHVPWLLLRLLPCDLAGSWLNALRSILSEQSIRLQCWMPEACSMYCLWYYVVVAWAFRSVPIMSVGHCMVYLLCASCKLCLRCTSACVSTGAGAGGLPVPAHTGVVRGCCSCCCRSA